MGSLTYLFWPLPWSTPLTQTPKTVAWAIAPVMADANATREVKRIIFKIIETGLERRIEKEVTVGVEATTIGRME